MANINAFTGVGAFIGVGDGVLAAGMSPTLRVAEAAAAAHPAFWACAPAGAAAITPPRKRRNATATGTSVDRGTT